MTSTRDTIPVRIPPKTRRKPQVTVPNPAPDLPSLQVTVLALKELAEVLAGQRGDPRDVAVTWGDLLDLGIVKPPDVPQDVGSEGMQRARRW
jgi:hypothetical protein